MKIVEQGDAAIAHWWHGVTLCCRTCGRKVKLEKGDDELAEWMRVGPQEVAFACQLCGDVMSAKAMAKNP